MSMNIIAGYRGEAHITSQQLRNKNIGIFGDDVCILAVGSEMAATVISANEVDIADGILVAEGCTAEITHGTVEAMAIDNGAQGMLRTDLIVARYTKNSGTGVEDMQLEVIKGTPAASNPATPSHTTGSIADGDTTVDFPLYEVHLDGIAIDSVVRIPDVVSMAKQNDVTSLATTVTSLVNKVGDTAMGTVAATITGAIHELLTKINANTSNVTDARNRVSALETKTAGIVRMSEYNVAANTNDYKQLSNLSTYVLIVNAASTSNTLRGMYLIGVTTSGTLGIKAINTAADVVVVDGGSGLLKVTNNGAATLRCTLIRTYGG